MKSGNEEKTSKTLLCSSIMSLSGVSDMTQFFEREVVCQKPGSSLAVADLYTLGKNPVNVGSFQPIEATGRVINLLHYEQFEQ